MESFTSVTGTAVPFMRINIDTDQITPGPEILRGRADGYRSSLFARWRYLDMDKRIPDPDFILNREPWKDAAILLADRNFGCGSSRESAPQALRAFGFRSVIAPSFGGIFFNNSFRNGLLPVELPIEDVRRLAEQVEASGGKARLTVDLEAQRVTGPDGATYAFRAPSVLREMLLAGVDEIDLTLSRAIEIAAFRDQDRAERPWAYKPSRAGQAH
jgi:3-isopropylmalate/(R)-2-methylmalate dehydratase small subunit